MHTLTHHGNGTRYVKLWISGWTWAPVSARFDAKIKLAKIAIPRWFGERFCASMCALPGLTSSYSYEPLRCVQWHIVCQLNHTAVWIAVECRIHKWIPNAQTAYLHSQQRSHCEKLKKEKRQRELQEQPNEIIRFDGGTSRGRMADLLWGHIVSKTQCVCLPLNMPWCEKKKKRQSQLKLRNYKWWHSSEDTLLIVWDPSLHLVHTTLGGNFFTFFSGPSEG